MSVGSISPNNKGQTFERSKFFESAPASNTNQGASGFPGVMKRRAMRLASSSFAISLDHREPFETSSGLKYGRTAWSTLGSHFRITSAIALLRSPDQLRVSA